MGVAMLLTNQFQNGALARYPEAARELATFAIASSIFGIIQAALIFVPQMSNVYCQSAHATRICFRFVMAISLALSFPLIFFGFTFPGRELLRLTFGLDASTLGNVALYLQIVTPLVLINGVRHFLNGLLVQAKRTLTVTALNVIYLCLVLSLLYFGLRQGWRPMVTIALSQVLPAGVYVGLSWVMVRWKYRLPETPRHENLTYRETFAFFWPVALTSIMFAFTRPVIYGFVSRTPNAVDLLAALRVSFDVCLIFFNPLNQFRHLYVTFGLEDPRGVRRFMIKVMSAITMIMILVVTTPLGTFVFSTLLGLEGEVLRMAVQATWVLCLVPFAMTFRNYFHGLSLVHRRTGRMGIGAVLRTLLILFVCWLLQDIGWLNQFTAAGALVLGFLIEAFTVMFYQFRRPARTDP